MDSYPESLSMQSANALTKAIKQKQSALLITHKGKALKTLKAQLIAALVGITHE